MLQVISHFRRLIEYPHGSQIYKIELGLLLFIFQLIKVWYLLQHAFFSVLAVLYEMNVDKQISGNACSCFFTLCFLALLGLFQVQPLVDGFPHGSKIYSTDNGDICCLKFIPTVVLISECVFHIQEFFCWEFIVIDSSNIYKIEKVWTCYTVIYYSYLPNFHSIVTSVQVANFISPSIIFHNLSHIYAI